MSASTLLHSLFKYKAWANGELFAELEKLDPAPRDIFTVYLHTSQPQRRAG